MPIGVKKAYILKPGDQFRWKQKGRKWYEVMKIQELTEHDHIAPVGRKMLIILPDCKQITFLKEAFLFVPAE